MAAVSLRFARLLRRTAAICDGDGRMRKRRKVKDGPRLYAWEEDGYEGLQKVTVKDPEASVGWKKFISRDLGSYKSKRFRTMFRIPSEMLWEMHDKVVASGWKEGDLHETCQKCGFGSPIPLAYKLRV